MRRGNKPTGFILVCFAILCVPACRPASPSRDIIYTLDAAGGFAATTGFPPAREAAFIPWPRQVRVTDLLARNGTVWLAVNGRGLAEARGENGRPVLVTHYDPVFFAGRTVTRLFSLSESLFCHVYFDTSFPDSPRIPPPASRLALLRIDARPSGVAYAPQPLAIQAGGEPWEAVGAGLLDPDTLVLEWRSTIEEKTRFRYSICVLPGYREEEKSREWFYARAAIDSPERAADQLAGELMQAAARTLESETPGCIVIFSLREGEGGVERRYLSRGTEKRPPPDAKYHLVRLTRTADGVWLLHEDGRYVFARSAAADGWRRDRLPSPPPGCRYTVLSATQDLLCAAWEQYDFYKVGRAGIVVRNRETEAGR